MEKVDDLIQKIKDTNSSVSDLLRDAKILSKELDVALPSWITQELEGYRKDEQVPQYRKVTGQIKGWNPFYGWIPVVDNGAGLTSELSTRGTSQSISEIEELLSNSSDSYEMPYPDSVAEQIVEGGFKTKLSLFISRTSLTKIVETVRNNLLDWALEITKETRGFESGNGKIQKEIGGMRLAGGVAVGPLMFSNDGKTAENIIGPAIIPFDYGVTNSLNTLNKESISEEEFQSTFNSQVQDLVSETLIYLRNRLKPIAKTNVREFNSIDKYIKEYAKHSIYLDTLCDTEFLLALEGVRGRKYHSNRRYDADYTINNVAYDSVEKLRDLNRKVHKEIHAINDSLAQTHKDYDVEVNQTEEGVSIEFKAVSHTLDLTKKGKPRPKKQNKRKDERG